MHVISPPDTSTTVGPPWCALYRDGTGPLGRRASPGFTVDRLRLD